MSEISKKITDKRQYYLGNMLKQEGCQVYLAEELSLEEKKQLFSEIHPAPFYYLLPIPVSTEELEFLKASMTPNIILLGGNLPETFLSFCTEKKISCLDYMRLETVAMGNAIATAEGIISRAISETPINLHGSRALVIGFGKCGEILAEKLSALHVQVFISTRNPLAKKRAECYGYTLHQDSFYPTYQFLFNTAPAMVLPKETIDLLEKDVAIFDLASRPGGTDFDYCKQKGISAGLYPGLPGKYAPKTSAQIIYEAIKC